MHSPHIAPCTLAAQARRERRQAEENRWAATFGRKPRNFLHVGPYPMGCEESFANAPVVESRFGARPEDEHGDD